MTGGATTAGGGCHLHHDRSSLAAADGLARLGGRPLGLSSVHHIGMIVADRDKALAGLGEMFTGPPSRMDATFPPAKFRGNISTATLRLGFVWMGNLLIEVLQPVDDQSPQGHYLKQHGEGLHHLGFIVPSIEDHLNALGRDREDIVLADGTIPGNELKWVYVDSQIIPGVIVELIEQSSAAEQFFQGIYDVTGGRFPT